MKKTEPVTIGNRLKKARQKSGLSLDEVYKKIKIHPRILEDLEEDRIDIKLGEIYIKSFLKKYANFLGLDDAKILLEFTEFIKHTYSPLKKQPIGTIGVKRGEKSVFDRKESFKKLCLFLAAVFSLAFVISIIGFAGFKFFKDIKKVAFVFIGAKEVKTEARREGGKKLIEDSHITIPIGKPLILKIETKDKVWVRVKSDGKIVFENILPNKSIESWHAKDTFELRVGKPEAVSLTLNGNVVRLPSTGTRIKDVIIDHTGLRVKE